LSQLCVDMQALSRGLHSPSLDLLGLVSVTDDYCAELAARHQVHIDFDCNGVPKALPEAISLCLYRVLQETLQNAVKHSGSPSFQVELQGSPKEIRLTVRDLGEGFDLEDGNKSHGLGLTSMRERLKLVNGQISIQSTPHQGTTIEARVPLPG
jgi:signal transduction histidine kinase